MTKLTYLMPLAMLLLAGCNDTKRIFDSEISAIDRQSKVLKEQNRILERIATILEETETKGESK